LGIYNLTTLAELLYTSFIRYLVESKNYPNHLNIFEAKQEEENLANSSTNFLTQDNFFKLSGVEILVDLVNGNALKISHSGKILKAFHGVNELCEAQIKKIYGEKMQIPEIFNFKYEVSKNEHYFYLQGYFEYHMPAMYLFCVELYDKKIMQFPDQTKEENVIQNKQEINFQKNVISENEDKLRQSPYKQIMSDIFQSLLFNYAITDKKMEDTGYFYTEISRNPKKYLCENSARETLLQLKKQGIKIFYATNSYKEFGDLIMSNSLGEDFLNLFDLCISFSRKPAFFEQNPLADQISFKFPETSLAKYASIDQISLSLLKQDSELFEDLKLKKSVTANSFEVVKFFFEKLLNKKELNFIYVGDSIMNDCIAPVKHANIKAIAVIEFIDFYYHGIKPDHLAESWRLELEKDTRQVNVLLAREHAEFSISNVQSLKLFC
jgi:phenolic acid decarboxylase